MKNMLDERDPLIQSQRAAPEVRDHRTIGLCFNDPVD